MTSLFDHDNPDEPQRVVKAFLTKTPPNVKTGLRVRIPIFDALDQPPRGEKRRQLEWGPCPWTPLTEPHTEPDGDLVCRIVMPVKGDPCWVAFDEENRPIVVTYWPKLVYERLTL